MGLSPNFTRNRGAGILYYSWSSVDLSIINLLIPVPLRVLRHLLHPCPWRGSCLLAASWGGTLPKFGVTPLPIDFI